GSDRAHECISSVVSIPGKHLAETEERDRSRIVRHGRQYVMLNINNRVVEPPLIVKLNKPLDGDGLVLRVRGSFRQNFSGFLEPPLSLENRRLPREHGLVAGRNFENTIKDRLCLIKTAHTREVIGNG